MRPWKDRSLLRGRLHGRLFKVLGIVVMAVAAIAVWQFLTILGGDEEEALTEWTEADPITGDGPRPATTDASESTEAPTSASASPSDEATSEAASAEPSEDAATSEAAPEPAPPQCTASLTPASDWANMVSVDVDVVNTGEESMEGWEIVLDLEDVEVTATWGMEHVEGDRYRNGLFNGDLDPGESAEPSFQGETQGRPDIPETVTCTVTAP